MKEQLFYGFLMGLIYFAAFLIVRYYLQKAKKKRDKAKFRTVYGSTPSEAFRAASDAEKEAISETFRPANEGEKNLIEEIYGPGGQWRDLVLCGRTRFYCVGQCTNRSECLLLKTENEQLP